MGRFLFGVLGGLFVGGVFGFVGFIVVVLLGKGVNLQFK